MYKEDVRIQKKKKKIAETRKLGIVGIMSVLELEGNLKIDYLYQHTKRSFSDLTRNNVKINL